MREESGVYESQKRVCEEILKEMRLKIYYQNIENDSMELKVSHH